MGRRKKKKKGDTDVETLGGIAGPALLP